MILTAFGGLVGQTPGMRLLSIHLEADGSRALGLRRALKRVMALPVAVLERTTDTVADTGAPDDA